MAAIHDLEHHLGLVVPVLLLVPLDALVDLGEGALAQALALPRGGMLVRGFPARMPRPPGALLPPYLREALGVNLVEHHLVEAVAGGGGGAGGLGAAAPHDQQVGLL